MAKYLGPNEVVAAAMMYATSPKQSGITTWKNRSPVRSACNEFKNVVMTARTYGGTVKKSVVTLDFLRV
jgi:hypothetical protein